MTKAEASLARASFGDQIDLARTRLVVGPWRSLAVTVGSTIFFPRSVAAIGDFAAETLPMRCWFIHELAHVWQFQRRPIWTVKSWLKTLATGGYGPHRRGYRYPASPDWGRLNLEQQAEVVADVYRWCEDRETTPGRPIAALRKCLRGAGLPLGAEEDDGSR